MCLPYSRQGIPKLKQEKRYLHFAHNKYIFPYILIGGGGDNNIGVYPGLWIVHLN